MFLYYNKHIEKWLKRQFSYSDIIFGDIVPLEMKGYILSHNMGIPWPHLRQITFESLSTTIVVLICSILPGEITVIGIKWVFTHQYITLSITYISQFLIYFLDLIFNPVLYLLNILASRIADNIPFFHDLGFIWHMVGRSAYNNVLCF